MIIQGSRRSKLGLARTTDDLNMIYVEGEVLQYGHFSYGSSRYALENGLEGPNCSDGTTLLRKPFSFAKSCWFMLRERKRQYEPDFIVFFKCMSRETYRYPLMLVRDPGPDAVIVCEFSESEELRQSMLDRS